MIPKVDFFIVGAPKCGTTALAQILEQNPEIVISSPKEPHYFCADLNTGGYMPPSDEEYLSHFFPEKKGKDEVWGEASVWNMYSEVALKRIKEYNPSAKIIAVVRDPARASFSLHQQMIYQVREDETDFPTAWHKSSSRFEREEFPVSKALDPKLVAYRHAYDYLPQLERIYENFPSEQILIVRQEDFKREESDMLAQISDFLATTSWDYKLSQINKSKYFNSPVLTKIFRSRIAKMTASALRKALGVKTLGIGRPSAIFRSEYADLVHKDLHNSMEAISQRFDIDVSGAIK